MKSKTTLPIQYKYKPGVMSGSLYLEAKLGWRKAVQLEMTVLVPPFQVFFWPALNTRTCQYYSLMQQTLLFNAFISDCLLTRGINAREERNLGKHKWNRCRKNGAHG